MDFSSLLHSVTANEALLWWSAALSVLVFIASLVFLPFLVAWIPDDYFVRSNQGQRLSRYLPVHLVLLVLKNMLGLVLLLVGLSMLFLPGQGLLTVVVAILLLNFPGKPAVVLWLVQRRPVLNSINWLRRRRGRPPLQMPDPAR